MYTNMKNAINALTKKKNSMIRLTGLNEDKRGEKKNLIVWLAKNVAGKEKKYSPRHCLRVR